MKRNRILLPLAALGVSCFFVSSVSAATSYKVTVSSGLHGKLSGNMDMTEVTIAEGGEWNPTNFVIPDELIEEGYYFKGYHLAGVEGEVAGAQVINEDKVFVASYGISNDIVEYYVNYVDEAGNVLHPRATLKGNAGDKPVVAYVYIDGYIPQTRNYTGTLSKDTVIEFTFVYSRPASGTDIIYVTDDTGTAAGGTDAGGTAAGGTAAGGTAAGGTTAGGTGEPAGGEAAAVTPSPEEAAPVIPNEIIDIDDPNTPTSNVPENNTPSTDPDTEPTHAGGMPGWVIPTVIGALAVLGILIFLLLRKKNGDQAA